MRTADSTNDPFGSFVRFDRDAYAAVSGVVSAGASVVGISGVASVVSSGAAAGVVVSSVIEYFVC